MDLQDCLDVHGGKARLDGELFLLLSAPQDFFPAPVVDIGRGHVADAFVITRLVVVLDELGDRPVFCTAQMWLKLSVFSFEQTSQS